MDKLKEVLDQLEAQGVQTSKWALEMRKALPAQTKENRGIYAAGQIDGMAVAYFLAMRKIRDALEDLGYDLPNMLKGNETNEESGSLALHQVQKESSTI